MHCKYVLQNNYFFLHPICIMLCLINITNYRYINLALKKTAIQFVNEELRIRDIGKLLGNFVDFITIFIIK